MSDGVLRLVPTRRAGVTWALEHGGNLLERHDYRGCWEYVIGFVGEDSADGAFVVRDDCLERNGWDPGQVPLFPIADDPHEQVDRTEGQVDELIVAVGGPWSGS